MSPATYSWPDPTRTRRRVLGTVFAVGAALTTAAGVCEVLDARSRDRQIVAAREVALRAPDSRERRIAVVILLRDAQDTIDALQHVAAGQDDAADQARHALNAIAQGALR